MKIWPLVALAWFFTFRGPDLKWVSVGPFSNQIDCENAREAMAASKETSLTCRQR